jgi:hypothetical protein
MERFSKLEKAVKKSHKSARKKKRRHESSGTSDSDSEYDSGYDSTVGTSSNKKTKLGINVTTYRPIKTTALSNTTNKTPRNTKAEQSPPMNVNGKGKVTAVVAVAKYGPVHHRKVANKPPKRN